MIDPLHLVMMAQRMLVDARTELLDLAEQIGKGERRDQDGETVMLITGLSARIGNVIEVLVDSTAGGDHPPLQ